MLGPLSRMLLKAYRPGRMSALDRLLPAQWVAPAGQAEVSASLVGDLLRHACAAVPFYREFAREQGLDPSRLTPADLPRFPLVDKRILQDRPERFLDPGVPREDLVPNFTGGSSGVPFRFFSDRRALEERKANDMRGRTWTGWKPGDKQAVLWAHPRDNKESRSLRGRVLATYVHRTRTLNAYDMDAATIEAFHRELKVYRPAMVLGFSSSLAFLAEYLVRHGLDLPPPRGIIASAETLTPEHRAAIEACFGCKLLNRYGSREFGVMAQQCEQVGGLHVFTDQVHLEILRPDGAPCAPGERGEIVVTDLLNRAMPFIRYRTGDVAVPGDGACPCGRGFPLLASVEGRTSELLVGRNGKFYSCLGPRFFGHDIEGIGQMQVLQESLDLVVLKIVRGPEWTDENEGKLTGRLDDLLGGVGVEFVYVDAIPPAPSGKFPFTISKVSPFTGG